MRIFITSETQLKHTKEEHYDFQFEPNTVSQPQIISYQGNDYVLIGKYTKQPWEVEERDLFHHVGERVFYVCTIVMTFGCALLSKRFRDSMVATAKDVRKRKIYVDVKLILKHKALVLALPTNSKKNQ